MRNVVIGAGVSGAHAALTLLERGMTVEIWDIGREEPSAPEPGTSFEELRERLEDPVDYFLGKDLSALIPPAGDELLRYPPSRNFLASKDDPLWPFQSENFFPFGSFNRGGLANGWGANALAFDDDDLSDWPVSASDLEEHYRTIHKRIRVAGPTQDDLTPYLANSFPSAPPVRLTTADHRLLKNHQRNRQALEHLGILLGQSRLAVTTDPTEENACDYCDRCLWGCPRKSIYNPATSTLQECETFPGFRYVRNRMVLSFATKEEQITGVRYLDTESDEIREEPVDRVFLAAGALASGGIFLRTLRQARPELSPRSEGLMDTQVVKIPYVLTHNIGQPTESQAFQFNRLIMGIIRTDTVFPRYLHGEVLHLGSLLYHPLIEWMPFDSRLSKRLFFTLKSALGTISLFFPDKISRKSYQELADQNGRWEQIRLNSENTPEKETFIRQSVQTVRSALWRMKCIPRGEIHSPAGGGIHYAGTIPMGEGPKCCDAWGRSNLFRNLHIADGAAFPSLPSKSITLSLAAHATRVAREVKP